MGRDSRRGVVVVCECGAVARVHPPHDVHEGDPAHLDEPEEALAAEQAVVLVRVVQVPVEGDDSEVRHRVNDLRRLEGVGRRLVGKVAHFDAGCEKVVHLLFDLLFDVADVLAGFGWCRRGWLGIMGGGSGQLGTVGPERRRLRYVGGDIAG